MYMIYLRYQYKRKIAMKKYKSLSILLTLLSSCGKKTSPLPDTQPNESTQIVEEKTKFVTPYVGEKFTHYLIKRDNSSALPSMGIYGLTDTLSQIDKSGQYFYNEKE